MANRLKKRWLLSKDIAYATDLRQAMLVQHAPKVRIMLYLMLSVILIAVVWAHFAVVQEITRAPGKVISARRDQIIQSLEGGILSELDVKEGDIVRQGQPLLRIDGVRIGAAIQETESKMLALQGSIARLRAEANGTPLHFPDTLKAQKDIIQNETDAFRSKQRAISESVTLLRQAKNIAQQELEMLKPLSEKGLVSQTEVFRLQRQISDLDLQIAERHNKIRSDANADLLRLEGELSQAKALLLGKQDVLHRAIIKAPVNGIIKNIKITTIGGVIQPGTPIMEIVPLEDQLLIEAKIKPSDVAFLRPGLPATIKVTAYDYAIYGGLKGSVEHISPDTLREDPGTVAANKQQSMDYYRILIRTNSAVLQNRGKPLPIIPGMIVEAQIRTGEKSILDYILKPIFKAKEAFRER